MYKTIVFRIYPDKKTIEKIKKTEGCCRFIYNYALDKMTKAYYEEGIHLKVSDIRKEIPALKKKEEYKWLAEADSKALITTLNDLDRAFIAFYEKRANYPKFKKKKNGYRTTQLYLLKQVDHRINLNKLGFIKMKGLERVPEHSKNVTLKCYGDKWYAYLCYDTMEEIPEKREVKRKIGIDVGIKSFMVGVDNDDKIYNLEPYMPSKKDEKRIIKMQKRVTRKPSDSINREKARIRLERTSQKITRRIHDDIHKITNFLTNTFDEIHEEDLNINGWFNNHRSVNKKLSRRCVGEFRRQLEYKCEWRGVNLIKTPRRYPSSQICSNCGFQNILVRKLNVRIWTCPNCGAKHDRDVNAAYNILNYSA